MKLPQKCYPTRYILLALILICLQSNLNAQTGSDSFYIKKRKGFIGKLVNNLFVNVPSQEIKTASIKNTIPFMSYKGAIIRNIIINKVSYGHSIVDTSRSWETILDNLTNLLKNETRKKTIERNLFFSSGDSLRPFLLADNERFLRELPYIQDARIIIKNIKNKKDSIDILVLFKDMFPFGFNLEASGSKQFSLEVKDENMRGKGDKLVLKNFTDITRTPHAGWGGEYTKSNIGGSFVNLVTGITNCNNTINSGSKQEQYYYTSLQLPLVSPYRLFTGAIDASIHQNSNKYFSDSLYNSDLNYHYKQIDSWVGYNLSCKTMSREQLKRTARYFVAFRVNYTEFEDQPNIYKNKYNYLYANSLNWLVSAIAFKQEYYKTSFIYGFGRNEDIPEGYKVVVTGGWTNKYGFKRSYFGLDLQRTLYANDGIYFNYQARAGTYFNQGNIEDANVLLSADIFSKLYQLGNSHWLLRHFLSFSATKQLNARLNQPLLLNSSFGLPPLTNPDSLCNTRVTINEQSVFFNTYSFVGFKFAPFVLGSISYVRTTAASFHDGDGYTSFGFGVRTRNENLIFGTMELKVLYMPRTTFTTSPWNIGFNTELSYRYNTQYIKRPDFISVN